MIGCEWVIDSFAFSAYPAGYGGVSDLFGSLAVIAFVVESFRFWVLSVPQCLTVSAACGVARECSAVETRALD